MVSTDFKCIQTEPSFAVEKEGNISQTQDSSMNQKMIKTLGLGLAFSSRAAEVEVGQPNSVIS